MVTKKEWCLNSFLAKALETQKQKKLDAPFRFPLERPLSEDLMKKIETYLPYLTTETRRRIAADLHERPAVEAANLMFFMCKEEKDVEIRLLLLQTLTCDLKYKRASEIIRARSVYLADYPGQISRTEVSYFLKFIRYIRDEHRLHSLALLLHGLKGVDRDNYEDLIKEANSLFLEIYDKYLIRLYDKKDAPTGI
ncbi:MAG: hypothetical protein QXZ30_00820 [Candidatus Bilamarchaeaceae archaeon]